MKEKIAEERVLALLYTREKIAFSQRGNEDGLLQKMDALISRALESRCFEKGFPRDETDRLTFIITRACQLRCPYCIITKSEGDMPLPVLRQGIEALMSGQSRNVQLHFFGAEPLMRFDLIEEAVALAEKLKRKRDKKVCYVVSTNAVALRSEMVRLFKRFDFLVGTSLDGTGDAFGIQRPSVNGRNLYPIVRDNLARLRDSGVSYYVTLVATPDSVSRLEENVRHVVSLGHRRVNVNYEVGSLWPPDKAAELAQVLASVSKAAWENGTFEFVNEIEMGRYEPHVLDSDLVLDVDGNLYLGMGIFLETLKGIRREDFLLDSIGLLQRIDAYSASKIDGFLALRKAQNWRNVSLRSVILNNIDLGFLVRSRLREIARQPNHSRGLWEPADFQLRFNQSHQMNGLGVS